MVRQAPVICVMVPPIHLGAWSMALMLWLPFELLLLLLSISFLPRSMFSDERPRIDHNCRSLGTSDVHLDRS